MVVFSSGVARVSPEFYRLLPGTDITGKVTSLSRQVKGAFPGSTERLDVEVADDHREECQLLLTGDWGAVTMMEDLLELWMNDLQSNTESIGGSVVKVEPELAEGQLDIPDSRTQISDLDAPAGLEVKQQADSAVPASVKEVPDRDGPCDQTDTKQDNANGDFLLGPSKESVEANKQQPPNRLKRGRPRKHPVPSKNSSPVPGHKSVKKLKTSEDSGLVSCLVDEEISPVANRQKKVARQSRAKI